MTYLILALTVVLGVFLLARWFVSAEPKEIVKVLKIVAALVVVLVIIVLALSGRLLWALAALPAGVFWLVRLYSAVKTAKSAFGQGKGPGNATGEGEKHSEIKTKYLHMKLDHATGRMFGTVRAGVHRGRDLDMLPLPALLAFLTLLRVDDLDSARLLETYLDRVHGASWRERESFSQGSDHAPADGAMSRQDALKVLGLEEGASPHDIKAAHRRLMANLHPDHGGSSYLAAQINRAKDVLLG